MLTISNIRYCGFFKHIEKTSVPNEGDSLLVMTDIEEEKEHLFVVIKKEEHQHTVSLDDKLALFKEAFSAERLASDINNLGSRFSFQYR